MTSEPASRIRETPLTLEEWAALPEDEPGELCDGCLVEEEVPDYVHELVVAWLIRVLGAWVCPAGGVVGGSEAKFAVLADRGRKPDVTVYFPESPKPPRRGIVRVPPDIAIEVITATPRDVRRDRIEKMDEYATFGVRFYWLVDPESRLLEIFERGGDGRYKRALAAGDEARAAVPGCPGLRLDLSSLWAEADRLADEQSNTTES